MKLISKRVERLYMSALVSYARANGEPIDVRGEALADLRQRLDFSIVLDFLHAKGFIETETFDGEVWYVTLTGTGAAYFETDRDVIRERRWTRGLAIAALILSVISIGIAGLLLYLQWRR